MCTLETHHSIECIQKLLFKKKSKYWAIVTKISLNARDCLNKIEKKNENKNSENERPHSSDSTTTTTMMRHTHHTIIHSLTRSASPNIYSIWKYKCATVYKSFVFDYTQFHQQHKQSAISDQTEQSNFMNNVENGKFCICIFIIHILCVCDCVFVFLTCVTPYNFINIIYRALYRIRISNGSGVRSGSANKNLVKIENSNSNYDSYSLPLIKSPNYFKSIPKLEEDLAFGQLTSLVIFLLNATV